MGIRNADVDSFQMTLAAVTGDGHPKTRLSEIHRQAAARDVEAR